ncbi:DUF4355 domain-containing protein [Clostridium paraputrificum]|uniref:DUF4355 domain-containing protein n=1 Tax=Clostridium paraputrificum TaxID=29363 RepID=UPI00040E4425|nr:DUF4355 domain-containing protein [Clostridium paraputrificum]
MEENLNLQEQETTTTTAATEEKQEQKFFSQEDVEQIVTKRLAREKAKMEKEQEKQKRLAEMSAEERLRADMEEQANRLKEFERKALVAELKDKASSNLRAYGVDNSFSEFLIGEDEESTLYNVKKFKNLWDVALKNAVDKALAGTTPAAPKTVSSLDETDPLLKAFNKAGW